jgi:hypothetical protein
MIQRIIADSLALKVAQVERIIASASHSYYHFQIPKRNGGLRDIYHPSQKLKLLQRWVTKALLTRLPVSSAAAAYEEGSSIVRNARMHVANRFLLRLDFANFFPSLTGDDVKRLLTTNRTLVSDFVADDRDLDVVRRITCRFGSLTIGAPSSPVLSNRIMEPFDTFCLLEANARGMVYTRYADDLFFSCGEPNVLQEVPAMIERRLGLMDRSRLRLNAGKTIHSSKKGRRVVTGLRLTSEDRVSLGREFKRSLRTKVHLATQGSLPPTEIGTLRGLLAFAKDVEPDLLIRLRVKYGTEAVDAILG